MYNPEQGLSLPQSDYSQVRPAYPEAPLQQSGMVQPVPPQTGYLPQRPMPGGYPPQQPVNAPYPPLQPYPYQMPYPMPQIIINNTSSANANATNINGVVRVRRRGTPVLLSVIWFLFIGWWVGFYWVLIAAVLYVVPPWQEGGRWMFARTRKTFFLR